MSPELRLSSNDFQVCLICLGADTASTPDGSIVGVSVAAKIPLIDITDLLRCPWQRLCGGRYCRYRREETETSGKFFVDVGEPATSCSGRDLRRRGSPASGASRRR